MYIWPDGNVTGSEHAGALETLQDAIAAGTLSETLDEFPQLRQFIPEHLTAADYARPKKTAAPKAGAKPKEEV